MAGDPYSTLQWEEARAAALRRDSGRCTVARLLGGPCSAVLHVHHIQSADDRPDLFFDLHNLSTVCASHHPRWEAVRRAVLRVRGWKSCPHKHTTKLGRQACEARLNRELSAA